MACATNTPALKSPIKTAVSSIMARILHTQPALVTSLRYQPVCFRMISSRSENGFVARFCSSSARSRTQGSRVFYPAVFTVRGCKPDQGCRRIWKATAWTDVSHCIAGATDGPETGEGTWVKSSSLCHAQNSSACVSTASRAREVAACWRQPLRSAKRRTARVNWQTAEIRPIGRLMPRSDAHAGYATVVPPDPPTDSTARVFSPWKAAPARHQFARPSRK
jgi:hypothetical protein